MRDAKIHRTAQAVDGGEEAREAASMRWKAIEGFNTAPGLSPVARRLGIALVCSMDSKSRACFPSEIRLAALLDVHPSAVKKAKAELKKAGLTDWHNPGGPRHLSHYGFAWKALQQHSADAKERADRAVTLRAYEPKNKRTKSFKGADTNILEPSIGTRVGTNGINATNAQSTQNSSQGTDAPRQSTHTNPAKVPTPAPELSHYPPTRTTQQHHAASQAKAAVREVEDRSFLSAGAIKSRGAATPKAPEVKQRKPHCYFPLLETAFRNEPNILATLSHQSFDCLRTAAVALAKGGPGKAREVLTRG
jgi:hypothetical protein